MLLLEVMKPGRAGGPLWTRGLFIFLTLAFPLLSRGAPACESVFGFAEAGPFLRTDYLEQSRWHLFRDREPVSVSVWEWVIADLGRTETGRGFLRDSLRLRAEFNDFVDRAEPMRREAGEKVGAFLADRTSLSPTERQYAVDRIVLDEYFKFLHRPLNQFLQGNLESARDSYGSPVNDLRRVYGVRDIDTAVNLLHGALARAPGSRGLLFRGHSRTVGRYGSLKEGEVFTESGFLSTSVNPWGVYKKNVTFLILAKDAKFALNTVEVSEAVLDRDSRFRVIKRYSLDDNDQFVESGSDGAPARVILVLEQL